MCVVVWICLRLLVDESKYSVAMASVRSTGFSFSVQRQAWGRPG